MLTANGFACSLLHPTEQQEIRSFNPNVYQGWNVASCYVPAEQILETRHSPWPGFIVDLRKLDTNGRGRGWTVHMLCNGEPMVEARYVDELFASNHGGPSITIPFNPVFPSKTPTMAMMMSPFGYEPPPRTQPQPGAGVIEIIVMPSGRGPVPFLSQKEFSSSGHIAYFKFSYAPLHDLQRQQYQQHPSQQQQHHETSVPSWVHTQEISKDWLPISRKRPPHQYGTFPPDLPADWRSFDPAMRERMEHETNNFLAMDWVRSLGGEGAEHERTPRPAKTPVPAHRHGDPWAPPRSRR